jgi:dihydroorotase-like cyclic amidohydrolase
MTYSALMAVPPAAGMDADFVVWDPDQPADTSEEGNMHKHKLSPYTGRELWGKVLATFVGGSQVYRSDVGMHKDVCGSLVLRRKTFVK